MRELICDIIQLMCFKLCYGKNYMYMMKSQLKRGNKKRWIANKFYMNSHLKDNLRIEYVIN